MNASKKLVLVTLMLGSGAVSTALWAQTSPEQLNQRLLAASCANCHGTDGKSVQPSTMRSLHEQTADDFLSQLLAYRHGTLTGTIMPQLVRGYSDEQLKSIAQYFGKK